MNYTYIPKPVPLLEREQVNRNIIESILSGNTASLDRETVFSTYTGKGGLHGLNLEDFNNYFEYAAAKKVIEKGQFFTPHSLCEQIVSILRPEPGYKVADLTCGMGNFFNAIPSYCHLYGNELDIEAFLVCEYLYPQVKLTKGDFTKYTADTRFDLILGNPPFNISTELGDSQHAYIKKSYSLLKYAGLLAVIVPKSYLSDGFIDKRKMDWVNERFNFLFQCLLPQDSFEASIETKLMVWQKKGVTNDLPPYTPGAFLPYEPETLYSDHVYPVLQQAKRDRAKLHLFTIRNQDPDPGMEQQLKKKLWHIKESPKLRAKHYQNALELLEKLKTQTQPPEMEDSQWMKVRLTPAKVLAIFKRILREQNAPQGRKELKVVKMNYGLRNKAYDRSLTSESWTLSVHELLNREVPAPYGKLYNKKKRELEHQTRHFDTMQRDTTLDQYLNDFLLSPAIPEGQLFPLEDRPNIELKESQKHDMGLILQKRYALLSWEQGGGKSVAGMTFLRYRHQRCKNIFLLAPALAIEGTWMKALSVFGYDYIRLQSISDTAHIKKGQIVLVSFEILHDLSRFVKAYVKRMSYKIGLLVDESDELTNPNSLRTQAALKCFRKGSYKLLMTGTSTRNTINELYTQFELLYNNSTVFMSEAKTVFSINKEGKLVEKPNTKRGKPFAAYKGYYDFKACFCPHKTTVFGVSQELQHVYNEDLLSKIIGYTIISRSFLEIVGERKHTMHTLSVKQSESERKLYGLLVTDFLRVCYHYYNSTGNTRKEAGLRLIRQIMVLIKASSVPHLMPNYDGDAVIGKYLAIKNLVQKWHDKRVTIGTTLKDAARNYYQNLNRDFPTRKIFYIDGEMTPAKRLKVLAEFKKSRNGILSCTQASLKSSLNIPYCNRCILESMQWNIPKMSQFYFRFIRLDNIEMTQVYLVNYENTIEINLLALLMAKEKLNQFVKSRELVETNDLYDSYDIDMGLLEQLITKEYDEEGRLHLRWGSQTFSKAA